MMLLAAVAAIAWVFAGLVVLSPAVAQAPPSATVGEPVNPGAQDVGPECPDQAEQPTTGTLPGERTALTADESGQAPCGARQQVPEPGDGPTAADPVPLDAAAPVLTEDVGPGSVYVAKEVTGPGAGFLPSESPFPASFTVEVTCEQPTPDGFEPLLSTKFLLLTGEQFLVSDQVPMGSRCWGRELGSFGATTSSVVPGSPADAAIISEAQPQITVTATNDYQVGRIEVAYVVAGSGDPGAIDVSLACFWRPTGVGLPSDLPSGIPVHPAGDDMIQVPAGESLGFDVPVPSTCTATAPNLPDNTTVTYQVTGGTPGQAAGEVTLTSPGQTATVTLTIAQEPPAPGPSKPSLPATGPGALLTWGPLFVLATMAGALLMVATRRTVRSTG